MLDGGVLTRYRQPRPNDVKPFRPSQYMPGFLYLENHKNERKHLKMGIWTVLDLCNLILNPAGGPGLTALYQTQRFRNSFDIGLRLGAVANTCSPAIQPIPARQRVARERGDSLSRCPGRTGLARRTHSVGAIGDPHAAALARKYAPSCDPRRLVPARRRVLTGSHCSVAMRSGDQAHQRVARKAAQGHGSSWTGPPADDGGQGVQGHR